MAAAAAASATSTPAGAAAHQPPFTEEQLIAQVYQHNILYDKTSFHYKDPRMRMEAWEEIGRALKVPGSECLKAWRKLRNCYMNAIKRRRFSSKATHANKKYTKWKFEDEMSFLLPYMLSGRAMSHEHSNEEEEEDNEDGDPGGELVEAETAPTLKAEEPAPSPGQLHAPAYGAGRRAEFTGAQEFVSVVMANGRAGSHSYDDDDEPDRDEDDDEGPRARRRPRKRLRARSPCPAPSAASGPEAMDDTEMFFLSMAKTVKKLPRVERVRIRMDLCRMVSEAELRNLTNGYRRK
ncbi:uncharacterized protein LOC126175795 [Schistocerca cancellata]|uniref:uncharacterized protein LOC126175795 n=1 Tax=Schistocerca cancellata TaxID=274614 RepID=UPI002118B80F|nr:uncharacterized protein LOC126175795 [Schistocerca cancellata]